MRYEVTVEAVIRKTFKVEAADINEAQEKAHEMFTVECDGDEYYSQDILEVCRDEVDDESRSNGPRI